MEQASDAHLRGKPVATTRRVQERAEERALRDAEIKEGRRFQLQLRDMDRAAAKADSDARTEAAGRRERQGLLEDLRRPDPRDMRRTAAEGGDMAGAAEQYARAGHDVAVGQAARYNPDDPLWSGGTGVEAEAAQIRMQQADAVVRQNQPIIHAYIKTLPPVRQAKYREVVQSGNKQALLAAKMVLPAPRTSAP